MTRGEPDATDIAVDALIVGEADALPAGVDARRAAGLLVVHGLLGSSAGTERLRAERVVSQAFARVRDEAGRETSRPRIRRTFPLAASLAIAAGVGTWWVMSSEHRAVATISTAHKANGPRRYDLVIERDVPTDAGRTLQGTCDVDGLGCFVVTLPLPTATPGNRVVFGKHNDEYWIVTPAGSLDRAPSRDVVDRWIRAVAGDAPFPSVDETIARLEADYDVTVESLPDGGDRYRAVRNAGPESAADSVELTINRATGKLRVLRWQWNPPEGAIARIVTVEARLLERRPFADDWFAPETHRDASSDREPAPTPTEPK